MNPLSTPAERQRSARTVQAVALTGVACSSFAITVLSASLADIAADLNSTTSVITWVISAPLLAFAVFTPMAGKLGDLYGHRQIYLIGFTSAAVFSLATALAPNALTLIVLRVLAQSSSAATGPSALAIIMSVFPEERRTHVTGTWSAVLAASPAVGVVVGGPLIDATSWRILFVIQGLGMVLAVVMAWRVLPATERNEARGFDLVGSLLLASGIGVLLIAFNRASAIGWSHPLIIAGLASAPIALAGFAVWERRTRTPLVDLTALRRPNVALPIVSQVFLNGPYMAGLVLTSLMLASVFDLSTTAISLMILPRPLAFATGASLAGSLVNRLGGRMVVTVGLFGITVGLGMIGVAAISNSLPAVALGVSLAGFGSGMARPPIIAALTEAVGDHDVGVGTGLLNMAGQLGAATGISVLGGLVTNDSTNHEFMVVLGVAAVVSVIAIGLTSGIRFSRTVVPTRTTPSPTSPYSAVVEAGTRTGPKNREPNPFPDRGQ